MTHRDVGGRGPLASLLVRSGRRKGERLSVRALPVYVGQGVSGDLVIEDDQMGAPHARLERHGAVWLLTDLGASGGTNVDGEPAGEGHPLSPGSIIRVGGIEVLFEPLDDNERAGADSRFVGRDDAPPGNIAREAGAPRFRRSGRSSPPSPEARRGVSVWFIGLAAAAAVVIAYLLLS